MSKDLPSIPGVCLVSRGTFGKVGFLDQLQDKYKSYISYKYFMYFTLLG